MNFPSGASKTAENDLYCFLGVTKGLSVRYLYAIPFPFLPLVLFRSRKVPRHANERAWQGEKVPSRAPACLIGRVAYVQCYISQACKTARIEKMLKCNHWLWLGLQCRKITIIIKIRKFRVWIKLLAYNWPDKARNKTVIQGAPVKKQPLRKNSLFQQRFQSNSHTLYTSVCTTYPANYVKTSGMVQHI